MEHIVVKRIVVHGHGLPCSSARLLASRRTLYTTIFGTLTVAAIIRSRSLTTMLQLSSLLRAVTVASTQFRIGVLQCIVPSLKLFFVGAQYYVLTAVVFVSLSFVIENSCPRPISACVVL